MYIDVAQIFSFRSRASTVLVMISFRRSFSRSLPDASLVICHGPDAARPLRRLRPDRGAPQAGETTGRNSRPAGRAELAPRRTSLVAAPAGTFHVMVCGKYSEKILPSWVQGSVNPSYVCCFINPLIVAISWYKPTSLTVGHHIVSNIPSFINTKITHSSSFPQSVRPRNIIMFDGAIPSFKC